jgi:HPt (histidine-containing phosphotransfer) domain-containing protein
MERCAAVLPVHGVGRYAYPERDNHVSNRHERGWSIAMAGLGLDQTSVVDLAVLQEISDLMEDDFTDLVHRFLKDAEDLLTQMDQGVAQSDAAVIHRAAHTLKSSAAALGAVGLSDHARHLESLGRAGVLTDADAHLAAAHEQMRLVKGVLDRYLAEGS